MSGEVQCTLGADSRCSRRVSLASTYSVYSTAPSMACASSELIMETLATPTDEYLPKAVPSDGEQFAHFYACNGESSIVNTEVFSSRNSSSSLNQDNVSVPHRPSSLERRSTTRDLISKYEAISNPRETLPARSKAVQLTAPVIFSFPRRNSPLRELPSFAKTKSQTSFSFRNLLTVFAKKNKSPRPTQAEISVSHPSVLPPIDASHSCSLSSRTGLALYLSSSTSPPVWCPCDLILRPSHLAVAFSENSREITRILPLLYCVNVASLAGHQLGPEIPTPFMGKEKDVNNIAHVFAMTFEGCEPTNVRFAMSTVAERSRWVSATWDAILVCRDPNTSQRDICVMPLNDTINRPPLKVINSSSQPSSSTSSSSFKAIQHTPGEHFPGLSPPANRPSVPTTPARAPRGSLTSDPSSAPLSLSSSPSIQLLGSTPILRVFDLDSLKRPAYAHPLNSRGISNSGSYVASSMKRVAPGVDNDRKRNGHASTSESSKCQEDNHTSTAKFSPDITSQKASFTALDAHAMYYEPAGLIDAEVAEFRDKNIAKEKIQLPGGTTKSNGSDIDLTGLVENSEEAMNSLSPPVHEYAAEQSFRASNLASRLTCLDTSIETIVANLKLLSRGTSAGDLAPIHAKLDEIKTGIMALNTSNVHTAFEDMVSAPSIPHASAPELVPDVRPSPRLDISPVLKELEELRNNLKTDLPLIMQKLEMIETRSSLFTNMAPAVENKPEGITEVMYTSSPVDMTDTHTRIESLTALCTTLTNKPKDSARLAPAEVVMHNISCAKDPEEGCEDEPANDTDSEAGNAKPVREIITDSQQIAVFLRLLQEDKANREMLVNQQADSVRYLNELNAWLENFVTSNVANMRKVTASVDQLCNEWLPAPEARSEAERSDSNTAQSKADNSQSNSFACLQHFLTEQKEQSENIRDLRVAIRDLTETLREDMAKNAEARFEVVRHVQAQESLFNGLATELTKEIRGERLRFVDAMKDATSVNVALHVEEFKKVLGRLHHEKMILEQQIAELFSFVAKQHQNHSRQPQDRDKTRLDMLQPPPRPLPQINNQKSPPGYAAGPTNPVK